MKQLIYTKFALRSFRIISFICAIFISLAEIFAIINLHKNFSFFLQYRNFHNVILNFLVLIGLLIILVFPQKIGIMSFISFIYAYWIIIFQPNNYTGILMYFLGISLLFARGLMKKYKKIKLSILICLLYALCLTHLRFGIHNFFQYLLNTTGGILLLSLYIFFMQSYFRNVLVLEEKKLNIASYSKLTERDCRILQSIQKGIKYSVISKEENLSEGSLKNRLHIVFDTLEVGDKQGFISSYEDWELFFCPERPKNS